MLFISTVIAGDFTQGSVIYGYKYTDLILTTTFILAKFHSNKQRIY